MKTQIYKASIAAIFAVFFGWNAPLSTARAQNIQPICSFDGTNGENPEAALTLGPDGNFYGTTEAGGDEGAGTVFQIRTNGTLTTLVSFGADGAYPYTGLTLGPDGNFYGTTYQGGSDGYGTVFEVTTNGTLTTLVSFHFTDGSSPEAGLTLGPNGNFYGTTASGDSDGNGTVFEVTTNGTLTTLVNFNGTNGEYPQAALTLGPDGNFYGTTASGGSDGNGTVFQVTTNGTLTMLYSFSATSYGIPYGETEEAYINSDGANPLAALTLGPDGNFYGTTSGGGSYGDGTVFEVTTNGALTTLVNFNYNDGEYPHAGLTLGPDGNFYGTTYNGGSDNLGAVFEVTTNGTLTTLASFNGTDGEDTEAGLTLGPDGNFYGTTYNGGSSDNGVVYRLVPPPFITNRPASQTVPIGGTADLTVSATSSLPLSYQWYFNNNPVANGTNDILSISPALTNDEGSYQVVVTNLYYSVTSAVATLTVLVEPNIYGISYNSSNSSVALSLAGYPGSSNYLYATTNLALPLYEWQLVGTILAGTNGLFQLVDTNTKGVPDKFYLLASPAPPSISSVSAIDSEQTQTIAISGSGFGTQSPYDGDSDYIYVNDTTRSWEAGNGGNTVTLDVTSWTSNQITISGFTGNYGGDYSLDAGDTVIIGVWNPQTGAGPATYTTTVQGPPVISSVSTIEPDQTQTITISGSGFGTNSPYDGDSDYIYVNDTTHSWEAGNGGNTVTLDVTSWTSNQITISGFTGNYGGDYSLDAGDTVIIGVWNPQTGAGPATYTTTVQ